MKTNYNNIWIQARKSQQTMQGGVLCTWAPIYLPNGKKTTRVFNFQKSQSEFTLIEDAAEEELQWMQSGISMWGKLYEITPNGAAMLTYKDVLDPNSFFNPNTLHVGRLTDQAIEWLIKHNYHIADALADNPYVLYQPNKWVWMETETPSLPEPQRKRNNKLLLGLAASAILTAIN